MIKFNFFLEKISWLIVSAFFNKIIQLVTSVFLIRLLTPEIFGLTAISLSIFYLTQGLLNMGFESALIQDNLKINQSKISSAWTMEVLKGIILCVVLFSFSHQISLFLEKTEVRPLLQLTSLIFLIDGFKNIHVVFLKKNMNFKKIFILEFFPFLASSIFTLLLAIKFKEAWIIIAGLIVNRLLYTLLSYVITNSKLKLKVSIAQIKDLFSFGKWIILSSILSIVRVQGVNFFLAKCVGFESLGIYNRSVTFSEELFNQVNNIYWKFGYPYLSKNNLDNKNLLSVFTKTFEVMFYITLILFYSLILIADVFVNSFFDVVIWADMIVMIKLISIYSLIMLLQSPFGILYQSIGLPRLATKVNFLFFIVIITTIYPFFLLYHVNGVIFSLILSSLVAFIYNNYLLHKYIELSLYKIYYPLKNNFFILLCIFLGFNICFESSLFLLLFPFVGVSIVFKKHIQSFLKNDQ